LERGLAPFLGCRRWRNYLRVQGSIFGCRRWRNPLVVPLRTWVCGARARHAWPLHHGAIIK